MGDMKGGGVGMFKEISGQIVVRVKNKPATVRGREEVVFIKNSPETRRSATVA